MAQDPSKTEKPSPKRRAKARTDGSVLKSSDVDGTIMLWGALLLLLALGGTIMLNMTSTMAYFLARTSQPDFLAQDNLRALAVEVAWILAKLLLPFLAAMWLLALCTQAFQHGLKFNGGLLMPKFSKLNPMGGFKRLFSIQSVVNLIKSLAKFVVIVWVAYSVVLPRMPAILSTMHLSLGQDVSYLQETLFALWRKIMMVMIVVAGADFLYQRHSFEKSLRMSKQELKDEAKDADGNPEIKGKQKAIAMARAMRRIMNRVPKASVVITNPTHFAVALQYEPNTAAPILVAKGVDHLALKIRELAKASGVIIVENPPLARAIYHNVELDQPIPSELYQAVAQVLAYVYRLKGAA